MLNNLRSSLKNSFKFMGKTFFTGVAFFTGYGMLNNFYNFLVNTPNEFNNREYEKLTALDNFVKLAGYFVISLNMKTLLDKNFYTDKAYDFKINLKKINSNYIMPSLVSFAATFFSLKYLFIDNPNEEVRKDAVSLGAHSIYAVAGLISTTYSTAKLCSLKARKKVNNEMGNARHERA